MFPAPEAAALALIDLVFATGNHTRLSSLSKMHIEAHFKGRAQATSIGGIIAPR